MKSFYISPFVLMMAFFSLISDPASAADKIGNGGGVWVCQGPALEVFDIMFMDVFEARREYQLTLPESQESDLQIVQAQKKWIETFLQEPRKIVKHVEYVEKNITWIEDIINLIPDAASKITPHPSTCKEGEWTAVQLVNFTEDFRILVRRELFESKLMSNLERAAVYMHEGIYSYLRSEFGDSTSVRARAIVGFLLSNLSNEEKVSRIQKVLKQEPPIPDQPVTKGWICGIKPERHSALYISEGTTAKQATEGALNQCKKGENPMPDFPGMPGGPPSSCRENKILCEAFTSSEKSKKCQISFDHISSKVYPGLGRTRLEAQSEAMTQCLVSEGSGFECYRPDNMTCE